MLFQGVVQDRKGTPLPDVLIIAWPKGKRGEAVAQARSGEDGRFFLPGLRPDRWKLLVEAAGLGTLETERQVPEDGDAVLALEGESRTLTGIVTDAGGRPQAGAQVALGGAGLRWTALGPQRRQRYLHAHRAGQWQGHLAGDPREPRLKRRQSWFSTRPPCGRRMFACRYTPASSWRGAWSTTRARPWWMPPSMSWPCPRTTCRFRPGPGCDGRFRLGPIAPGKHQVLARLEDHVPLDAPEPQLGVRSQESFELRMARTASVQGRVLDEAGRAMVGVSVTSICLIGGRDDLVVIPGALPLAAEAAALPVGRLLRPGGVRSSTTDPGGAFVSPAWRQAGPASRSSTPTSCPSGASPCSWCPATSATSAISRCWPAPP